MADNTVFYFPKSIFNIVKFDRNIVLGELGEGNSIVFQGTFQGEMVAVKRIAKDHCIIEDGNNFDALIKLDHENVLKILANIQDDDFRYIVLELCCGSLFQVIQKTYKGPGLPSDREVMYQIADGLDYVHSQNLIHFDIKPENILISMTTPVKMKLADFGFVKKTEGKCYVTGWKGALLWKAPEQFRANREDAEIENAQKSDIFSCGCVFLVFLTRENGGIHPFGDIIDHLQIYTNIQEGNSVNIHKANDNHPLEGKLIQKMIQGDPAKRITSEEVKNEVEDMLPKRNNTINPFSRGFSNKVKFNRKDVLGEGYSTVFRGTYEGKEVAVKRIVLNPNITGDGDNFEAQMKLDHKNVLKILAVEEDLDFRYVVLELCSGTLFQVIQKTYNGPELPFDREVMYQIANGLHYIHSRNLVHRDVKPDNILISMTTPIQLKLSDFGLVKKTEGKCYVTGPKGVLLWKAPELFQANHEEVEIEIAQKCDVFSCGCVFFVFLMRENDGMHPFGDFDDHLQIYANIQEGNSINLHKANRLLKKLIQEMIHRDPIKRITSGDVKKMVKDLFPKRSAIKHLTRPISSCNQGKKSTADNGMHSAESHEKSFSNHGYEVADCDSDCTTSFIGSHVVLPIDQQPENQHATFPKTCRTATFSLEGFTQCENVKQPQQKSRLPIMVHYNFQETGEAKWKFTDIGSQQSSCDSNNNNDPPMK